MTTLSSWDQRYLNKTTPGACCWLLQEFNHLLPVVGGNAFSSLDVACGLGANALKLAQLGFTSHAWDNSQIALDKVSRFADQQQLSITCQLIDIERNPPTPNCFDVIVVSQFLHRPLCQHLIAALKPGGVLFYQTYHGHKQSSSGPSSEQFLLAPNELLSLFADLQLVFYREDAEQGDRSTGLRDMAYLVAKKQL